MDTAEEIEIIDDEDTLEPMSNAEWRYYRIKELAGAIVDTTDISKIKTWVHELKSLT